MTPQLWLQSERDYDTGRRIYEALGSNAHLKRTLSSGPSTYNREALAYELGKLVKAGVDTDVVLPLPAGYLAQHRLQLPDAVFRQMVLNEPEPITSELPAPAEDPLKQLLLDGLKEHVQALYDKRRYLHAQLELADEPTRLAYALDIQRFSRSINEHWKTVAYVKEHGHLPVVEPAPPAIDVNTGTLAELKDVRNNLRSQISKLKKKPARADDLARAQAEEKALTARIEQLKGEEVRRG